MRMPYAVGFLIALAVGLTGVGAGSITAPILILFFAISPAQSVGTALIYGAIIKLVVAPMYLARKQVNRRVMDKVREALPFHESQKPYKEAVSQGAMHLFEEKYGDVVRVVCFGDWTCELCGGTHVQNTADVGPAVIVSESSIGSGLRRIDMVVGEAADGLIRKDRDLLNDLARSFNASPEQLSERVQALRAQVKQLERERDRLREQRIGSDGVSVKHGRVDYITDTVDAAGVDELKAYADRYLEKVRSGIVTLVAGDKFVIKVSKDLTSQYDANRLKAFFGGKGGGPSHLVTGTLTVPAEEAFQRLDQELK